MKSSIAWSEGWCAREDNKFLNENPFEGDTEEWKSWDSGWNECDAWRTARDTVWLCSSCNVALGGPCELRTVTDWITPTCCPFGEHVGVIQSVTVRSSQGPIG